MRLSTVKMAYLLLHITGPGHDGGIEQPGQAIKLGSLNAGRPDPGVLVTKEDMAFIELDGPNEWILPEIGSREAELNIAVAASGISATEQTVVLETPGGAFDE